MSLRQPVRATLSPISVQARVTVSAEKVSVPGYSICSFDLPIAWMGRKRTGRSFGTRSIARARYPSLMNLSTPTGRCGPCCSIAATGSTATTLLMSAAAKSRQLISAQSFVGSMPILPVQAGFAATASISTLNSGRAKPCTTISVDAGGGLSTNSSRTFMYPFKC